MKNILFHKKHGAVHGMAAAMLVTAALALVFINSRLGMVEEMKVVCEDALVASTLAAAVINAEEYGRTENTVIDDYHKCYEDFKESLDQNLKLNDAGHSAYAGFFEGPIEAVDFIIYNVKEDVGTVQVMEWAGGNLSSVYEANLGSVSAPDGTLIEGTSVYSKIKFDVRFSNSRVIRADKDCCVDIKEN